MFSLVTLPTTKDVAIRVTYKDKYLDFIISSVIAAKGKPKVEGDSLYVILNSYLDYKGEKFKENLFKAMEKSLNTIMFYGLDKKGKSRENVFPYEIITEISNLMDFKDIFNYIKNVFKLIPPRHLQTVFEEKIEKDARGSRDQTYLKDDYLELATLVVIVKATIGPICMFAKTKESQFRPETKEYLLFYFYRNNPVISKYEPMIKLRKFTEKLINQSDNGAFEERKRVLDRGIPIEETSIYLLSVVVMQKLATAVMIEDDENKNLINKIYNYVNSKLKATNSTSKTIRDKEPMSDTDSASGDKESNLESLRVYGELPPGTAIEMDWAVETVDKILSQLPKSFLEVIDKKVLKDAASFTKGFEEAEIERCNIDLLCFIFKSIMSPWSMEYVKLNSIINLKAVGFAYLWGLGFKSLAVLLVSTSIPDVYDVVTINSTLNKPRLSKELKEKLDELFPYRRQINDGTSENVCEKALSELTKEYESKNWRTLAGYQYAGEGPVLPSDLKVQLAEFIIENERMTYGTN